MAKDPREQQGTDAERIPDERPGQRDADVERLDVERLEDVEVDDDADDDFDLDDDIDDDPDDDQLEEV